MSFGYSEEWKNRTAATIAQEASSQTDQRIGVLEAKIKRLEVYLFVVCLALIAAGIAMFVMLGTPPS